MRGLAIAGIVAGACMLPVAPVHAAARHHRSAAQSCFVTTSKSDGFMFDGRQVWGRITHTLVCVPK